MIFEYKGKFYPEYLKTGNACQFAAPFALQFCKGNGLDVGSNRWPLAGSTPVELTSGGDAMNLPNNLQSATGAWDYIFSSHCLEHLKDPIGAIEHWKSLIKPSGVLFLYLPHPDMEYWLPQNCRKHLHSWRPGDMSKILSDMGFAEVIHSERDLAWGFCVVGVNK